MTIKKELDYLRHARQVALDQVRHAAKKYGRQSPQTLAARERASMLEHKVRDISRLLKECR